MVIVQDDVSLVDLRERDLQLMMFAGQTGTLGGSSSTNRAALLREQALRAFQQTGQLPVVADLARTKFPLLRLFVSPDESADHFAKRSIALASFLRDLLILENIKLLLLEEELWMGKVHELATELAEGSAEQLERAEREREEREQARRAALNAARKARRAAAAGVLRRARGKGENADSSSSVCSSGLLCGPEEQTDEDENAAGELLFSAGSLEEEEELLLLGRDHVRREDLSRKAEEDMCSGSGRKRSVDEEGVVATTAPGSSSVEDPSDDDAPFAPVLSRFRPARRTATAQHQHAEELLAAARLVARKGAGGHVVWPEYIADEVDYDVKTNTVRSTGLRATHFQAREVQRLRNSLFKNRAHEVLQQADDAAWELQGAGWNRGKSVLFWRFKVRWWGLVLVVGMARVRVDVVGGGGRGCAAGGRVSKAKRAPAQWEWQMFLMTCWERK